MSVAAGCGARRSTAPDPSRSLEAVRKSGSASARDLSTLRDIIFAAFDRHGVKPQNRPVYLALAHLESKFAVDAISPMGAVGVFQLMANTAAVILRDHPDLRPREVPLFNPRLGGKRRFLVRGKSVRRSHRAIRWHARRLRARRDRLRVAARAAGRSPVPRLAALDARFDPFVNASLAVFHLEQLRTKFYGRRRCHLYQGKAPRHRGKKYCRAFSGRTATLLAAAGYHLGTNAVASMLAVSRPRTMAQYLASVRRAGPGVYRSNYIYIRKLLRLSRTYARLLKGGLRQEELARAFPRLPALARRLFTRYQPGRAPRRGPGASADAPIARARIASGGPTGPFPGARTR